MGFSVVFMLLFANFTTTTHPGCQDFQKVSLLNPNPFLPYVGAVLAD